jgi:NADH-quinone oxidoreductase subunit E
MAYEVRRYEHGSRVPGWDDSTDPTKDPSPVPDPATTPVPAELRAEIEAHMALYPDRRSAALPALMAAQRFHGWLSPEAMTQVACVMRLTPANMVAVASFYDMYDLEPVGHHRVYVCTNISCSINGAEELCAALKARTDQDPDIHLQRFECLGACDIAPMVSVDGTYIGPVELDEVDELLEDVRQGRSPLDRKQLRHRPTAEAMQPTPDTPRKTGDA